MEVLKLLILEDSPVDRQAILSLLKSRGYEVECKYTDTLSEYQQLLKAGRYDFIISDYNLKDGTCIQAMKVAQDSGIETPIIIVSGSIDDEQAVELVQKGAADYVLKHHLQRLLVIVERELTMRRERAEKHRIDRLFNSIFENANVGLKLTKLDGTIIRVNDEYCRISGYTKEEIEGQNVMIVVPEELMEQEMALFSQALKERKPVSVERRYMRKDGSPMDVMVNTKFLSFEDEEFMIISTLDIAEMVEYRTLLERTGNTNKIGGWELDIIKDRVRWTKEIYSIYGVGTDFNVNVENALSAYPEGDREMIVSGLEDALERGRSMDKTVRFISADGIPKWVQVTCQPIIIGSRVVKLTGTFQDITEQKKRELELENLKDSYEELFEKSPNPILVLGEGSQTIIGVNEAAIEKYGYSKDEFLKLTPMDLRPEEDVELFIKTITDKHNQDKKIFNISNVRHQTKNGDIIYVDIQSRILESEEGMRDLIQIVDVTDKVKAEMALIESEKEYRTLVEATSSLICKLTPDGFITFSNSAARRVLGYNAGELIGMNMMELVAPDDLETAKRSLSQVMKGKKDIDLEIKALHKDGSIRVVSVTAYPNFNSEGVVISIGANATDITYLKDYQKQLEDSIDEKEVLIKEIHHRVKNNLAVVSGLLELQGIRVDDDQLSVILKESQARIKSIAMIHEKLYQSELFTQVDAGKYLQELTTNIAQAYEHPDRSIELVFNLDSSSLNVNQAVPFAILANELISNSFKHAFDGQEKGLLEVNLKQDGPTLTFEISDNGKGLPENFDPVQEGSLGFTLILNLADQLDGEITWQSNGQGAAFKLVFDPNEAARTWASR